MIKAVYDYSGVHKGTLPFRAGDKFLLLKDDTGDPNWWQVVDNVGRAGFVPNNFVVKLKGSRTSISTFTDRVLERLYNHPTDGHEHEAAKLKIMEKIKLARDRALHNISQVKSSSTPADQMPSTSNTPNSTHSPVNLPAGQDCDDLSDHCNHVEVVEVARKQSLVKMPESLGRELIELIRFNTKLSYQLSKVAIVTTLEHIKTHIPSIQPELEAIIVMVSSAKDGANLSISHDAKRLREIFFELKNVKEDEEQRSWALYEDENAISEILQELLSILANADVAISKHCIAEENYEAVVCLVMYYQMEVRVTIRLLVLKVFGAMCALDSHVISVLLSSILPMELAREMQSSTEDIVRLNHVSLVMTMIFSSGETPPLPTYEYVNECFMAFLLDNIECPPASDVEEQVADLFLAIVLAINLHVKCVDSFIIRALRTRSSAKALTEKLLLMVNREEDSVHMFDHSPKNPNPSLKLLRDMLQSSDTAQLFYTNDVKVLLDILARNITDLTSEDERRNMYLRICLEVIRNTPYSEHQHRRCDLQHCFQRIVHDESPPNANDVCVVQTIAQEHSELFYV